MNPPTINQVVFDLLEATVTLYPANADGTPQLDCPIWTGAAAERLQARANWLREETHPSGAKHPHKHPLIAQYQVDIGRVWLVDAVLAPTGFAPDYTRTVLDVVWVNEDTQQWLRKTFYGVTIAGQEWNARDVESGLLEDQTFEARYYTADSGTLQAPIPPISNTLPYYVNYTDASGTLLLYAYDPGTRLFTAQADTNGRAVISCAGGFSIQFAADSQPVVATTGVASLAYRSPAVYRNANTYRQLGLAVNGGVFAGAPSPGVFPRLDFYYGPQRIATVTRAGIYEVDFDEESMPPVIPAGAFAILCGGSTVALIEAGSLSATNLQVTN
jgi:hypothetical protein